MTVNKEISVKWVCGDVLITKEKEVLDLSLNKVTEESSLYVVSGERRTKDWINDNCVNLSILDLVVIK